MDMNKAYVSFIEQILFTAPYLKRKHHFQSKKKKNPVLFSFTRWFLFAHFYQKAIPPSAPCFFSSHIIMPPWLTCLTSRINSVATMTQLLSCLMVAAECILGGPA